MCTFREDIIRPDKNYLLRIIQLVTSCTISLEGLAFGDSAIRTYLPMGSSAWGDKKSLWAVIKTHTWHGSHEVRLLLIKGSSFHYSINHLFTANNQGFCWSLLKWGSNAFHSKKERSRIVWVSCKLLHAHSPVMPQVPVSSHEWSAQSCAVWCPFKIQDPSFFKQKRVPNSTNKKEPAPPHYLGFTPRADCLIYNLYTVKGFRWVWE